MTRMKLSIALALFLAAAPVAAQAAAAAAGGAAATGGGGSATVGAPAPGVTNPNGTVNEGGTVYNPNTNTTTPRINGLPNGGTNANPSCGGGANCNSGAKTP